MLKTRPAAGDPAEAIAAPVEGEGTPSLSVSDVTISGQDYADDNGMLTFSPGDTEKEIRLSITDDGDQEGSEMFSVTLSNPTGDAEIESPDAEITIIGYEYRYAEESGSYPGTWSDVPGEGGATEVTVDGLTNGTLYKFQIRAVNQAGAGDPAETMSSPVDPGEPPALSVADVTVNEADGTVRVRVSLEPPSAQTVTVDWTTEDGTAIAGEDYADGGDALPVPGTGGERSGRGKTGGDEGDAVADDARRERARAGGTGPGGPVQRAAERGEQRNGEG